MNTSPGSKHSDLRNHEERKRAPRDTPLPQKTSGGTYSGGVSSHGKIDASQFNAGKDLSTRKDTQKSGSITHNFFNLGNFHAAPSYKDTDRTNRGLHDLSPEQGEVPLAINTTPFRTTDDSRPYCSGAWEQVIEQQNAEIERLEELISNGAARTARQLNAKDAEIKELQKQLQDQKNQLERQQQRIEIYRARERDMHNWREAANSRQEELLEMEMMDCQNERAKNAEKDKHIRALEEQLLEYQDREAAQRRWNEEAKEAEARKHRHAKEQELSRLRSQRDKAHQRVEDRTKVVREVQTQLHEAEDKLSVAEKSVMKLESDKRRPKDQLKAQKAVIADAKRRIEKLESEENRAKEQLSTAKWELKEIEVCLTALDENEQADDIGSTQITALAEQPLSGHERRSLTPDLSDGRSSGASGESPSYSEPQDIAHLISHTGWGLPRIRSNESSEERSAQAAAGLRSITEATGLDGPYYIPAQKASHVEIQTSFPVRTQSESPLTYQSPHQSSPSKPPLLQPSLLLQSKSVHRKACPSVPCITRHSSIDKRN